MQTEPTAIQPKSNPPYLLGLICIIPLVGAFVGLGLLLYGILKYKDKWLVIIGAGGIIWTKDIEFYKLVHGTYPDSLKQLLDDDKLAPINDPAQGMKIKIKSPSYYNYEKIGDKYLIFSSGQDGIPKTSDDLFPKIKITDSTKIGLIKNR